MFSPGSADGTLEEVYLPGNLLLKPLMVTIRPVELNAVHFCTGPKRSHDIGCPHTGNNHRKWLFRHNRGLQRQLRARYRLRHYNR